MQETNILRELTEISQTLSRLASYISCLTSYRLWGIFCLLANARTRLFDGATLQAIVFSWNQWCYRGIYMRDNLRTCALAQLYRLQFAVPDQQKKFDCVFSCGTYTEVGSTSHGIDLTHPIRYDDCIIFVYDDWNTLYMTWCCILYDVLQAAYTMLWVNIS